MQTMLPLNEAQQLLLSKTKKIPSKQVDLLTGIGMILAEDIAIRDALPHFRRSAMDGYAVRSIDTIGKEKVSLRIIEELPAGKVAKNQVETGTCIMLMTGAPLPEGSDAVIKREEVEILDDSAIIPGNIPTGQNVDPIGCDLNVGDRLLQGTVVGPGEAAVLASQGYAQIAVHVRPRIAIITTGDELLDINASLEPGKIRSSNGYMLYAAIKESGGDPHIYPVLTDDFAATKSILIKAGMENDLVLSTGGVSMGNYDFVRKALLEIADESLFWKVQIKPGMPTVGIVRNGTIFLGLSGKPNGSLLNYYLLACPVIAKLSGKRNHLFPKILAKNENNLPGNSTGRNIYYWAKASYSGEWRVALSEGGQLQSLMGYNALIEIPTGSKPLQKNDNVNIILLKDGNY